MDAAETRKRGTASEEEVVVEPLENRKRALDGGWGWMCVFGCTLMHFLIGGYGRSYGLIYLQLRKHFNSSAALTAWVGGACVAVRMGCSPLANALSRRFSARVVVFVGGLMVGTGSVLNAFATSTEYMIFSYTLIVGLGGSLVYSPALVVVGEYFEKRRGIAVGIATAGSGAGAFLAPPLMIFLFERYGFFSGLLIVGAIMFNCCVSGALYRPLVDNFPNHMTSHRLKLSPECGEETGGHNGRVDAKVSCENDRDGAEKEDVPLSEQRSDNNTNNEASESGRNRLSWFQRVVGAVRTFGRMLDVSVWSDRRFSMFALSQAVSVMAYVPVSMLAPAVAKQIGLSEAQAAFVLSALSSGDFVGRICSGFFFDLRLVRRHRHRAFSAASLFMALAILAWPFITSFTVAILNAIVFGVFMGVVIGQRTNMLCDLLGADRLSSSLGMLVSAQGVGVLVGPFLAGWFRDYFGNYKVSFVYMGLCMTCGSVLSYVAGTLAARKRITNERSPHNTKI
ncbi:hypothetical protein NP493_372g02034 [Ridgeia piscesae]|uniref:Major facilitator superfamily (MFS) profile domain-containing protein n=1 Tax=Ridgeia piscesae TaxID=27915 RepID=A0AAD9NT94_RIDPI|nr:hypothetical protein NP493_372g02034 [Ridgeia piscesae]